MAEAAARTDNRARRPKPIETPQHCERRTAPRYDLRFPIRLGAIEGVTRNLGLDGLLFESPVRFDPGLTVEADVLLTLGSADLSMHIDASGIVVRSESAGGGLFLTAIRFHGYQLRFDPDLPAETDTDFRVHPGA